MPTDVKQFIQLDSDGIVVAELQSAVAPKGVNIIEVTDRMDGPFGGLKYDKATDSFIDPKPPDVRPLAYVLVYDPNDKNKALKTSWRVGETMGLDVTIKDQDDNILTAFAGDFGIPILSFDPWLDRFTGTARILALTFVDGVATRTDLVFSASGEYGVDDKVSALARVASPVKVRVLE